MKTIFLDIMLRGRYICTLKYKYCPLFAINEKDMKEFIISKRPDLEGQPFNVEFDV